VHHAAVPAAGDVGRQQLAVEDAPGAIGDDGLDEVRRARHVRAGSGAGFSFGGAGSGAGSLAGARTGSTTIVRDRPGSVMPER
jgi:hypothetical protein